MMPLPLTHVAPQIPAEIVIPQQQNPVSNNIINNNSSIGNNIKPIVLNPPVRSAESGFHPPHSPQAFQPYSSVYRPYDPYSFTEMSPFNIPQHNQHSSENANTHPVYQNSPPPHHPPSWMWGAPTVPFPNSYAMHMKQLIESSPEYRQFHQVKQQELIQHSIYANKHQQLQMQHHQQQQQHQLHQQQQQLQRTNVSSSNSNSNSQTPVAMASPLPRRPSSQKLNETVAVSSSSAMTNSINTEEQQQMSTLNNNNNVTSSSSAASVIIKHTHPSNFVSVVNEVVLIDPDFDLDEEFDFLQDIDQPGALHPSTIKHVAPREVVKQTCEAGVNTDITLAWN
jgi:hypothetical protein